MTYTAIERKNIRLTITVTQEVHATFQRLAKGTSTSISKAMGDWLGDTIEAAEFMTTKVEQARAAPAIVMREMHAYALGLADETGAMMHKIRDKGQADRASGQPLAARPPGRPAPIPPSSNTGGKGTGQGKTKKGLKTPSSIGKTSSPPAKVQAYADTNGIPPKAPK